MPSWRAHIFLNVLFFIVWLKLLLSLTSPGIFYPMAVFVFVVIASVFPDIDTTRSKVRDWLALLLAALITVFYLWHAQVDSWLRVPIYFLGLYLFLRFFPTPHRTLTHTLFASIAISLAATGLLWLVFLPSALAVALTFAILFLSYSSHLVLDKL